MNAAISANYYSKAANPQGFPTWLNYTPTYDADGSMTYTSVTTAYCKFSIIGTMVVFKLRASGTTGGTLSPAIGFTVPINMANSGYCAQSGATVHDGGKWISGFVADRGTNSSLFTLRYDAANYGLGTVYITAQVIYEMA